MTATKPAHTPGPWSVDVVPDANGFTTIRQYDGTCYGDTDTQPIATVYDVSHARLIAAAPDLLAALRRVRRAVNEGAIYQSDPVIAEVSAAIARGES